jgi:hypothetical protein
MKAILNIPNPNSQYHKYNGMTFTIRQLHHSMVSLTLNRNSFTQTDFRFSEIIIVDFQDEVKRCIKFDFYHKLEKLKTYAKINRIDIDSLIIKYQRVYES